MSKFKFYSIGGESDTDTNTNIANSDLTADSTTRIYKMASGGKQKFNTNAGTTIAVFNDSGELSIGGASTYDMPIVKASAQYDAIVSTGTGGTTEWKAQQCAKGSFVQLMSGSASSLSALRYAVFKKTGGAMHTPANLTNLSFTNTIQYEAIVSNGTHTIDRIEYGVSTSDETAGITIALLTETSFDSSSALTFTATALGDAIELDTPSAIIQGEITALSTSPSANDLYAFAVLNSGEETINDLYIWLTIYYSSAITY